MKEKKTFEFPQMVILEKKDRKIFTADCAEH